MEGDAELAPKFRPEIVVDEPPLAGELSVSDQETAGLSNVNNPACVPMRPASVVLIPIFDQFWVS